MWVVGMAMMAVMVFGMHTADGAKHKGDGSKDVLQAVQTDHGYGQSSEGQHPMVHESGHGSSGGDQDGTAGEDCDSDRGKPASLSGSAPAGDGKDDV
jgi:hypothetical protein